MRRPIVKSYVLFWPPGHLRCGCKFRKHGRFLFLPSWETRPPRPRIEHPSLESEKKNNSERIRWALLLFLYLLIADGRTCQLVSRQHLNCCVFVPQICLQAIARRNFVVASNATTVNQHRLRQLPQNRSYLYIALYIFYNLVLCWSGHPYHKIVFHAHY